VTVVGAFIYRAGQLGGFKQLQDLNPYRADTGIRGVASTFCAIMFAQAAVLPFSYPIATVWRHGARDAERRAGTQLYRGALHCGFTLIKKHGVSFLYLYMWSDMTRFLGGSIIVVAYDRIRFLWSR
jgi:hypothetical protein